jgi:tripartite-type tricarboxylate transporter receptor subunit TctC
MVFKNEKWSFNHCCILPKSQAYNSGAKQEFQVMRNMPILLAIAATIATTPVSLAQNYPSRPITIIVPFPAGGPTDAIARILAEHMKRAWGQTVVIENVGGGGGTISIGRVVRAQPDGYTLSIGHWGTHVVAGAAYPIPYDLLKDLKPVALISHNPQMIISNTAVPARDLKELVAWIKANHANVTQGTTGAGSAPHVAGAFLQNMIAVRYRFIPYRGGAPAIQDLMAGHINLMIANSALAFPVLGSGKIRAFAVTSSKRMAAAPDIPTVDEAGLRGFHTSLWHAFWAPAGTPDDVVAKLNSVIVRALADADIRRQLEGKLGQDIPPPGEQTSEALGALHKAEIDKWWPIIRAANIKGE